MRPGVWPSRSGGSGVGGGRGLAVSAVGRPCCCPSAVCCCHCCTIHCCAIATSATITAVLHHQSRCDGRLTAIGMPSAVTLPDRPHCRCTARSGALTISGCHPRQDPPRRTPPPKVQTNLSDLSDQSVQPCFQFGPDSARISWRLVLGLNAIHEQPQRLAQKLQCPHLCAVSSIATNPDAFQLFNDTLRS
jgi:hypothetical protein